MTVRARLSAVPLWQAYLVIGAVITALYVFVPPFAGSGPVFNLLGLSPVIAILVGLRRYRPVSRGPWRWFVLGFLLFWAGDLYTYSYPRLFHHEVPFPSIGDAAYLVVYPALMAGLLILVRRRNPERDRAGLIDSLIITLGLSLISWVALIQPSLHDDGLSTVAKLVSIAYPVGDILLLAAAIRLAVDTGARRPAFYLLALSIVALLATDFAYGLVTLAGAYDGQVWLDVGWISFYLLWGAAALHPSMAELERAAPDRDARLTLQRLVLLVCASLIAPVMALLQVIDNADDRLVVNVTAILLFGLVVTRMAGLVRQQERSVARERILSAAGADLVAATSREDICHAALAAACELAGDGAAARLCLAEDGGFVAADAELAAAWPIEAATVDALLAAGGQTGVPAYAREELRLPAGSPYALALALSVRGETHGLLAIADEQRIPQTLQSSLAALATEVSLALESAALTEEVHRRTSEARFGSLVRHSSDLITVLDAAGSIVYQSPSIERILGYTPEEVMGTRFIRLLQPGEEGRLPHVLADPATHAAAGTEVLECGMRHVDGSVRQFEVLYTDLLDDENVHGVVLNGRDVSERKAFEEQLAHQAFHDPVTNLANRALFVERVRHALPRARRERARLAVIFMDLDDFKTINDSLGHAAGDAVLLEFAKRLDQSIRPSDTAARFGGDEFAVLLEDVGSAQDAADAAERILASLAAPLRLEGKELFVRCQPRHLDRRRRCRDGRRRADPQRRCRDVHRQARRQGWLPAVRAGHARRRARAAGAARRPAAGDDLRAARALLPAARASERWRSLRRRGAAALASPRARHPRPRHVHPARRGDGPDRADRALGPARGVPPGAPDADPACRPSRRLPMSVNLSVKQLQHSDIATDVRDALAESGLAAGSLTLEITETVMMTDTDLAVQRLDRAQGARCPARDGRLRDRLLVAQLPQPLPGRHPQDGPLVPA